MKFTAIINGERLDLELTRTNRQTLEAQIGEKKYQLDVKPVEAGVYWLHWNNHSIEISVTPDGEAYVVSIGGEKTAVEIVDTREALRKAGQHVQAGAIQLRAPMPGKIVKVLVNEGQDVEINQALLVIEAMKMQNEIKSPKKGTVRRLGVQESAAVNAGDLLAVVE
jgi:biotin carboxyl carrier protein